MSLNESDHQRWLTEMLATNRISKVQPNTARGNDLLVQARQHVASARVLATADPTLALAACHDAVRKAIDAEAGANGHRFENAPGAHAITIEYARTQLDGVLSVEDASLADRLRERRHGAEYGRLSVHAVGPVEIEAFAQMADRVVRAVIARRTADPDG